MIDTAVFRQTMDLALEMVLIFDAQGRILYANRAADTLLEYDRGVTDRSIADVFPSAFSREQGVLVRSIELGDALQSLTAYRGNRTCFEVEAKITDCEEQSGMFLCMAQDATKQNYYEKRASRAGQQAESAELVKTQFVANVTHELRTPVNGILGNTQELLRKEQSPENLKLLKLIERGCNDMHAIINNILDFSKLEAGKLILENRKFHFRDMMEYVRSNHINKITEKGLQFFMTISPDIPEYVCGDELRLVQVLNNLLSNASKFTSVGRITVEVVMTAQVQNRIELFFMVIDTGIGIAKEDQDKLFKSFSQVEASTTRKYGGTGLGLNISKQLVELMDGRIHVESEKNRGTMFSFHVWLEVPQEGQQESAAAPVAYEVKLPSLADLGDMDALYQYGTAENKEELKKKMNKLILSVEMDNWEKAEMFMDTVKQLTAEAPSQIKSAALRLKMAVQKADREKTIVAFENFEKALDEVNSVGE